MIAYINYVPHRKVSSIETNVLVMFREIFVACCVITAFRHEVDRNCVLLGYYPAGSGSSLPTFRGNLSVPTSPLERGPMYCPDTTVRNYHCSPPRNSREECSSQLLPVGTITRNTAVHSGLLIQVC